MGREVLLKILDLARWAPSGDNTQPWRFEIVSDSHIAIHGHDTREQVLYDFDGHASHMAHGALLETLRLAATRFGMAAEWCIRANSDDVKPIYDVTLKSSGVEEDPLVSFIESRCVQRRPMQMTPLSCDQKSALLNAVGEEFSLVFFETFKDRLKVAKLLWDNANLRLTCPEAYEVHCHVIEWGARFSKDRIPEQAVGVDPVTAKLMRWVMKKWERVDFFNRYLMGTIAPRIQLDYLPAIFCAAHILIRPKTAPNCLDDWVNAGIAIQKVWLTATQLGLHLQPEMTPVIFRWYERANRSFSARAEFRKKTLALAQQFEFIAGKSALEPFSFFCRVGVSSSPRSRSVRFSVDELINPIYF